MRLGLDEEQELFQYVLYDTEKVKGPRRINLDDPAPGSTLKSYAPPTSLKVHLSKIDIPELKPKTDSVSPKSRSASGTSVSVPPVRAKASTPSQEPAAKSKQEKEKDKKSGVKSTLPVYF